MREPARFSWRHWWNLVMALVVAVGVTSWRLRLADGRLSLLAAGIWLAAGVVAAPSVMYEHLGFLDRHVFHDYEKARVRYRKAVETGKATPQAMCALASLSLGEGDPAAAVELLEEAAVKRPGDAHLFVLLSRALSRTGRHEEAVAAALRCRKLMGAAPLCDAALGDALKAKGEDQGAASAYQKALEAAPTLAGCRVKLAELYLSMGEINASAREVHEALRLSPNDPDALYWAGRIAQAKGDAKAAGAYLRSALEKRPVDDRALSVPYWDMVRAVSNVIPTLQARESPATSSKRT